MEHRQDDSKQPKRWRSVVVTAVAVGIVGAALALGLRRPAVPAEQAPVVTRQGDADAGRPPPECTSSADAETCYAALAAMSAGGDGYGFTHDTWPLLVRYHAAIERAPAGHMRWQNEFRLAKVILDHLLLSLLEPQPEAIPAFAQMFDLTLPAGAPVREQVHLVSERAAAVLERQARECDEEEHQVYLSIGHDLFAALATFTAPTPSMPDEPRVREAACTTLSWRAGSRLLLILAVDEAIRSAPVDAPAAVERHFRERLGGQLSGVCPAPTGPTQHVLLPLVPFDAEAFKAVGVPWSREGSAPAAVRVFALASELKDWDSRGLWDHPLRRIALERWPAWSAAWSRRFPLEGGGSVRWDSGRVLVE